MQDPDSILGNLWCLKVPISRGTLAWGQQALRLPLSPLITAHKRNPVNGQLVCETRPCAAYGQVSDHFLTAPHSNLTPQVVQRWLVPNPGEILMVQILRMGVSQDLSVKVTTSIEEPQDNDQNWPGMGPVMVVAHEGSGSLNSASHNFSFFKVNGQWWRVDTAEGSVRQQDPFLAQMGARDRLGFSINFIVFKSLAQS
jgi:hypothetical protein